MKAKPFLRKSTCSQHNDNNGEDGGRVSDGNDSDGGEADGDDGGGGGDGKVIVSTANSAPSLFLVLCLHQP